MSAVVWRDGMELAIVCEMMNIVPIAYSGQDDYSK
ncbi:unknown [Prevotella sp. CAG:487]|nr:unknown [Prevotella sp. CAG:487]